MKHLESQLQQSCVRWFNLQYSELRGLLFAVPNGGKRNIREAEILKREGVVAGVSDLILLVPSISHHGLCIEMKIGKGKQTENQENFQERVERKGYKYIVCRSFDQFVIEMQSYLSGVISRGSRVL